MIAAEFPVLAGCFIRLHGEGRGWHVIRWKAMWWGVLGCGWVIRRMVEIGLDDGTCTVWWFLLLVVGF